MFLLIDFYDSYYLKPLIPPAITDNRKRIIAIKNTIFAIAAAPAAMPPKPNNAATRAIIKNRITKRSIIYFFELIFF